MKYHVLTPFSRKENFLPIFQNLMDAGVTWHLICEEHDVPNVPAGAAWVVVHVCPKPPPSYFIGHFKLNWFLDYVDLESDARYLCLNDDDLYEPDFFMKVNRHSGDVVVCSMKRGDQRPEKGKHDCGTLYACPENMRMGRVGIEQLAISGKALLAHRFRYGAGFEGDWALIAEVAKKYAATYAPEAYALFNYFEPGRWNPPIKKPKLDGVTLLTVDCVGVNRAEVALERCIKHFDFGDVKLLTSLPSESPYRVEIPPIKSINDYSQFMLHDVGRYVATMHAQVIQHDGWIINPQTWEDAWLQYDYIGAIFMSDCGTVTRDSVGNGGFSLRSKRLMDRVAEIVGDQDGPEDMAICKMLKRELVRDGMKFAPPDVAVRYSSEGARGPYQFALPFGFHRADYAENLKVSSIVK